MFLNTLIFNILHPDRLSSYIIPSSSFIAHLHRISLCNHIIIFIAHLHRISLCNHIIIFHRTSSSHLTLQSHHHLSSHIFITSHFAITSSSFIAHLPSHLKSSFITSHIMASYFITSSLLACPASNKPAAYFCLSLCKQYRNRPFP